MREWNLKSGDPLSLTIAADARSGAMDYYNDQIWELSIRGGEPPALALQTTFGLRARSFRIFPRFNEGNLSRIDPETFAVPPTVRRFAANYLAVSMAPFSDLEVALEYWIPESHAAAGRCLLENKSQTMRQLTLELISLLTPNGAGQRMVPVNIKGSELLSGISGGLVPVLFLTGGAEAGHGPYPSLAVQITLQPGETRQLTWAQAALDTLEASLLLAQQTATSNWEAVQARIDLENSGLLEIYTGNPEWDAVFALAQKTAYGLLTGPSSHLPHPSFVSSRMPGHGYSIRGDGLDYNHLWNGQSLYDAWFLADFFLPAAPHLVEGFLRNFFTSAREDGFVDWKPGLAGQTSKLLAAPLLASLALKIYQYSEELRPLREIFNELVNFVKFWLSPANDRDGDGIPEWSHPMHSGLEDHPTFSSWLSWAQGADISTAESPAMCAFLYREIQALFQIAELLEDEEPLSALQTAASTLRMAVETAWDARESTYRYWDRDSHYSGASFEICQGAGSGPIQVKQSFEQPARLLFKVHTSATPPPSPKVFIHGTGMKAQHLVEPVPPELFKWQPGIGTASSTRVFKEIELITVEGLGENDLLTIKAVDYRGQDITLLLPLWARIPQAERARALIDKTVINPERYWKPYGLPICPATPLGDTRETTQMASIPWNSLIGEALVAYGYREEAAELVSRLMSAVCNSLKKEAVFRKEHHTQTGLGAGEANAIEGLPPLGLFMQVLGVRIISPRRVAVSGFNPFPWPITVKYRGLTVFCQQNKTTVVFPDGQTTAVTDPSPCYVVLE